MRPCGVLSNILFIICLLTSCGSSGSGPSSGCFFQDCASLSCDEEPAVQYSNIGLSGLTYPSVQSGQGIQIIGDKIYLYSDNDGLGVVQEIDHDLKETGWIGYLSYQGVSFIGHPTGIAYHPQMPTFIGAPDRLVQIDWEIFREDGNLDQALLSVIPDTASNDGSRPEYVRLGNQLYVATADYFSHVGNSEIRLMDPEKLATAITTSDPDVVVTRLPIGSYTQDLVWNDADGTLIMVQNIEEVTGWRLKIVDLAQAMADDDDNMDEAVIKTICLPPVSELEGFAFYSQEEVLFLIPTDYANLYVASASFLK